MPDDNPPTNVIVMVIPCTDSVVVLVLLTCITGRIVTYGLVDYAVINVCISRKRVRY
jgi:hypothetical protein